jgi:hypothetical protein
MKIRLKQDAFRGAAAMRYGGQPALMPVCDAE